MSDVLPYIGVSSHSPERFLEAAQAIKAGGLTRLTSFMSRYNLLQRGDEKDKWPLEVEHGFGGIAFCPLAQGLLTGKYLSGSPEGGRLVDSLKDDAEMLRDLERARALNKIAIERGQTLAQMSLAWLLQRPVIASALIGASSVAQVEENVKACYNLEFSADELARIDAIAL